MCIRDSAKEAEKVGFALLILLGQLFLQLALPRDLLDPLFLCLLYTSDAADERSSVDLGGRRIIKKKNRAERDGVTKREMSSDQNRTTRPTYKVTVNNKA